MQLIICDGFGKFIQINVIKSAQKCMNNEQTNNEESKEYTHEESDVVHRLTLSRGHI